MEFTKKGDDISAKLSMWILLDELSDFDPKSAIQNGSATIEGFRLFEYEEAVHKDYVYIGYAREFFGEDGDRIILVHRCDIIMIDNAVLAAVLNRIIFAFDKYRRWNEKLLQARHEPNTYQAILDVSHEVLECPCFSATEICIFTRLRGNIPKNRFTRNGTMSRR
jgi:hypothetical protein